MEVKTVQGMGWVGVKNGALIELASSAFDVIFTVDRDFGSEFSGPLPIAVVILEAGTTDPVRLRPLMPRVVDALRASQPGDVTRVRGA